MKIALFFSLILIATNSFAIYNGSLVSDMKDKTIVEFLQNRVVKILVTKNNSRSKSPTPCTGTLINEKKILTAAHCLVNASKVEVLIHGEQIPSLKWMIHKGFKADSQMMVHDLGLIILSENVFELNSLQTIDLSSRSTKRTYLAAGFGEGMGRENNEDSLTISNDSDVIFTEKSIQASRFDENRYIFDQSKNSGAMPGDSGGPIFSLVDGKFYLSAVISKGLCGGKFLEVENIEESFLEEHNFEDSKNIKYTINAGRNFTDLHSRKILGCD